MTNDDDGDTSGADRVLRLADIDALRPDRVVALTRAYWHSLRRGRAVPDRDDISPAGLRSVLNFAFLLERVAPGAARFRLAGRQIVDLMGMEVRGMPACAILNPQSRGRFSDVLEAVFSAPQLAQLELAAGASYGRPALTGKMLILPLRSDQGEVTRALGCLATEGEIGSAPRHFDLTGDRAFPVIDGARVIEPTSIAMGFAEPPAAWQPAPWRPSPQPDGRPTSAARQSTEDAGAATAREGTEDGSPDERRARFRIVPKD